MIFIQLTGLSGSGKTTLAYSVKEELTLRGYKVEIIDGDEYRLNLCKELGFSKQDRITNLERLSFVAKILQRNGIIVILSAINPYEEIRNSIKNSNTNIYTVWVNCPLEKLIERDTKGLYKKALLPDNHPDKIYNFTGINDIYEEPTMPDLKIDTDLDTIEISKQKLLSYILDKLKDKCV
jgi:adenylylsulfate kinase